MISEGCLCDAPATVGLQSQSCGQPMIATAMAFIGFSLQSICIPPFNLRDSTLSLTALGNNYFGSAFCKAKLIHDLALTHSSCEIHGS